MKDVENDAQAIYRIAKQMRPENKDTVGEACIRDDTRKLVFNEEAKRKRGNSIMKGHKILKISFCGNICKTKKRKVPDP